MGLLDIFFKPKDPAPPQDLFVSHMELPKSYAISDRGVNVTDQDLEEAKKILFAEVSNRKPERQQFESKIILNTALNRMKQYQEKGTPKTLTQVLQEPNQYQGYNSPQYKLAAASTTMDVPSMKKIKVIEGVLADIRNNGLADSTNGSVFYSHKPDGSIWLKAGPLFK